MLDLTQREAPHRSPDGISMSPPLTTARLRIPDEELPFAQDLPAWALELSSSAPLPRQGDVLYLSSTSAWMVEMVIHERLSRDFTSVEVWIRHVGAARYRREPGSLLQ